MIQKIRVVNLQGDPVGQALLHDIRQTLGFPEITDVKTVKVFRLEGVDERQARELAEQLLCESITQRYVFGNGHTMGLGPVRAVEVAYKPGVMNPEAASILKAAHDMGITDLVAADTSREYYLFGRFSKSQLQAIVERLLVNKTVQRTISAEPETLMITGIPGGVATVPMRAMSDAGLSDLSKRGQLFLNLEEMKVIQQYFKGIGRNPTDLELETLAQTWSEHCGHKTFNARLIVDGVEKEPLITRLKKASRVLHGEKGVISAFHDNAGVIKFYDGYGISGKVETHNSPSAIEPYGGAATGSGGVFRDIMGTGQGMKCILSTDMFCFAPPDLPTEEVPPGCLHPDYLLRRVVSGVRDYGNRMGIPTANGSVHFHPDFRAKPTVIVGAYGIAPEEFCQKGQAQVGDLVFAVGGRTGRDGIHGATFSSGEMTSSTITVNSQAVQIGNAIEEKRMSDALLECRDRHLIRAITDCGAGGFSSAVGEMGEHTGVSVELAGVPLKYQGLAPWEIWISESQERMVVAVPPKAAAEFLEICRLYNVEATEIGEFTDTGKLEVMYDGEVIGDLSMEFLHHGLPQRTMVATSPKIEISRNGMTNGIRVPSNWQETYCQVLAHGRVCSKEPIVRQYDHGVQGTNALPPYGGIASDGPNDAVILTPLLGKPYGLVVSHGMNPVLMRRSPKCGALWAVAEAMANLVAVGGDPDQAVIVNNYIWPFPDEQSLATLDSAVEGVELAMQLFGVPVISGKDSLSSTYRYPDGEKLEIPPVLCISAFGKIPDVSRTVSSDFKSDDSLIVLVGNISENAIGGSVYEELYGGDIKRQWPLVDMNPYLKTMWRTVHKHIFDGDILACHDISEGGVAVTLAEMCFGGRIGAELDIDDLGSSPYRDLLFFTEMAGCFLVEVEEQKFRRNGKRQMFKDIPHRVVGRTIKRPTIDLWEAGRFFAKLDLDVLRKAWQQPMKEVFGL